MKIWTTSTLFIFITVFPTWILSCQTHFPAKYIDTYVIYIYNDKCRKPSFLKLMRECHQFVLFLRHSTARFHTTHCCIREVSANVLHSVSVVTGGDANVKTWEMQRGMQHVKEKWLGTWGWHDDTWCALPKKGFFKSCVFRDATKFSPQTICQTSTSSSSSNCWI